MKKKLWCAIWTPTDRNGRLLKKELKSQLRFLADRKVEGILACGSTGQFLHLDLPTRKEVLETIIEHKGPMEVIFNISHTEPRAVEELIRFSNAFPLTGVILLPPIYYEILESDLAAYFIHMASHTKHPFYLYSYPNRTHVKIGLPTLDAVHQKIPLAGIKLSGSDLLHTKEVIDWGKGKDFTVYAGNDILLPESLRLGAYGCMGGLVNIIPEVFHRILAGEDWTKKLHQLGKLVERMTFPWTIAAFMEARDLPTGHPQMPISTRSQEQYEALIKEYRSLLNSWNM